jgi:hypothetical protein
MTRKVNESKIKVEKLKVEDRGDKDKDQVNEE